MLSRLPVYAWQRVNPTEKGNEGDEWMSAQETGSLCLVMDSKGTKRRK